MDVKRWKLSDVGDLVLKFIVILTLVFGVYSYKGYRDLATCVAKYNNQQAANSKALRDAADKDRVALDEYVFALDGLRKLPPAEAQAKARAAFDRFVQTRRETNEAREKNPPPPPPSEQCS